MKGKLCLYELWLLPAPTENRDIWNFYGSVTLNNGKLTGYFEITWYAILWNRSHFLILCIMKEKLCLFGTIGVTCANTKSRHLEFLRLTDFE